MLNIQERCYRVLINSNILTLPVDVFSLEADGFSWVIIPKIVAKNKGLLNTSVLQEYSNNHSAFTIAMDDGVHIIIYDNTLSSTEQDQVIAHEIGHIVLGHITTNGILGKCSDKFIEDKQEIEANYFARILTAPPCILSDNGITDPNTISKITHMSEKDAITAAGEIQNFKQTKRTALENKLSKKFNTARHQKLKIAKKSIAIAVCILLATLLFPKQKDDELHISQQQHLQIDKNATDLPSKTAMPTLTAEPKNEDSITSNTVYAISFKHKFHTQSCHHIKGYADLIEISTDRALEVMGSENACKNCNPLND